jgi:outer membrane protein assembly factor BamB
MVQKTEKQITTGEKVLAVSLAVFVVVAGISFYLFMAERGKSKDVEAGEGINQAVFTRTGAVLELEETESIKEVKVLDSNGDDIVTDQMDKNTDTILIQFDWTAGEKYRFDVELKSGDVLSTPGFAPQKPQPYKLFSIDYSGEFPASEEGNHGGIMQYAFTKGITDISNDGKYCAVGLIKGRVSMVDMETQQEIWNHYIENVKIQTFKLSDDGNYLVVGCSGADAPVICYNVKTGEEEWRYNTKQDLGAYESSVSSGKTLVALEGNDKVWASSTFGWYETIMTRSYATIPVNESLIPHFRTRIYCFDLDSGEKLWEYPKVGGRNDDWGDGMIEKGVCSLFVSKEPNRYLSVGLQSWSPQPNYLQDRVVVIDAEDGSHLWDWKIPIVNHCSISINIGTYISPDGKYVTCGADDGRTFLFDNEKCIDQGYGSVEWMRDLGTPKITDGVLHHIGLPVPYTDGKNVMVTLKYCYDDRTFEDLPSDMLVYGYQMYVVYNMKGELVWDYYTGQSYTHTPGYNQAVDASSGYVTMSSMHQWMTNFPADKTSTSYSFLTEPAIQTTTFTVLDLTVDSTEAMDHVAWSIPLEGDSGGQGDISPDGVYVAFIEGPCDVDPTGRSPDIRGKLQLHVYT